jgi:hypothetical protein
VKNNKENFLVVVFVFLFVIKYVSRPKNWFFIKIHFWIFVKDPVPVPWSST